MDLSRLHHNAVDVLVDGGVTERVNCSRVCLAASSRDFIFHCFNARLAAASEKDLCAFCSELFGTRGPDSARPRRIRPRACLSGLECYSFDSPSFLICTVNLKTFGRLRSGQFL